MFNQLYKVLTKENLLEQSFTESENAMKIITEMFAVSLDLLRHGKKNDSYDIYSKDKEVNQIERDIRRRSLTHLAITGRDDLNPTLVLIAIIHDVERLGDYSKNIFELAAKLKAPLIFPRNEDNVKLIETSIDLAFKQFSKTFSEMGSEKSRALMKSLSENQKSCEVVINSIIDESESSDSKTIQLVVGVLYVRFLKRILAHLNNIATSSVNPFDRIGFEE